ncbi:MAG: IS110 family transposase [Gemmatimonadaceae bacterium]|nr:IS110 family transposase [Gemmatimonadaceae bacterium]
MVTVGLDLHKRYLTACALDHAGTVVAEARRLDPSVEALGGWLGALPQPLTIALEAALYWHWLERQLTALGHRVVVAHPYQVKLIWQARAKTDPSDARKLAELARANLLPAIWIPDASTRALRQLLRGRVFLVRQRTVIRNRLHAWLTAENLRCPELDLLTRAGQAWLAVLELPAVVRRQVDLLLENQALLTTQIQALDRHIKDTVKRDAAAQRLQTIPGVGPFGTLLLQAEIGPISRFGSAQELAASAGLVPSTRSSGGKTRHGAIGRGNPWLKWLLIEALQSLKLAPGPVGDHYRKLLRAKGKPTATVAAARKFCTYLYWMLKEECSYTEWLRQHDRPEVRPVQPLGSAA